MACTTDSASNNDTLMDSLEFTCTNENINFTKKHNHIRCLAHVINLAAQDALTALKVGYSENEDEVFNQNNPNGVIPKVKLEFINYVNNVILNLLIFLLYYMNIAS